MYHCHPWEEKSKEKSDRGHTPLCSEKSLVSISWDEEDCVSGNPVPNCWGHELTLAAAAAVIA